MPKRAEDITDKIIYENVMAIRTAKTAGKATDILMAFCERYRKNYTTVKKRPEHIVNKEYYNEHSKKWRETHREEYIKGRRIRGKLERWQHALEKADMKLGNLTGKQQKQLQAFIESIDLYAINRYPSRFASFFSVLKKCTPKSTFSYHVKLYYNPI